MYRVYKKRWLDPTDMRWHKVDVTNKAAAIRDLKRMVAAGEAIAGQLVANPEINPMTGDIEGGTIVFAI